MKCMRQISIVGLALALASIAADQKPQKDELRKLIEAAPADARGPDKGKWTEPQRKALEAWLIKTYVKQPLRLEGKVTAAAAGEKPVAEASTLPFTAFGCRFNGYVIFNFTPAGSEGVAELKKNGRIDAQGKTKSIRLAMTDRKTSLYTLTIELSDCTLVETKKADAPTTGRAS